MRARAADGDGRVEVAARDYAAALARDPADPVVAVRAYREGVQAGDLALADRAAATLDAAGVAPADAALLALARAAAAHDLPAARAALARLSGGQLALLRPSLAAWLALEAGADPLAALGPAPRDAVARRFHAETRALLLLARGQVAEGTAALRAALGNDQAGLDNRVAAARLLLGRGEVAAARALLVGDAPAIVALRAAIDRLPAGAVLPPPLAAPLAARPSLGFGAGQLFTRVASDLALGPPGPLSYVLTRAALRADPTNDRARLLLAGALSRDGAAEAALAVLGEVPAESPWAPGALAGRVQILAAAAREEDALALARAAAAGKGAAPDDVERLAALLLRLGRAGEAAPLYRRLAEADGAGWPRWLQYGAALDQAGDWLRARRALEKAVALAPEEPVALNYLGYGLITRGERLREAQAMLEKAARLAPDDAAITDSLGWSLFLGGEVARALPLIERAAAAEPANAEIGEHLGDAYWRAGRRYEARYAWAAARLVADPAAAQRLAGKIADGLAR